MPEYIEREGVYAKACQGCTMHGDAYGSCFSDEPCDKLIFEFTTAPAADVAPVVHGRWIKQEGQWRMHESGESVNIHLCSCCGGYFRNAPYKYCPECGARMDGDDNGQAADP